MRQIVIGVDVGGTTVKFGCFTTDADMIAKWSIPTRQVDDPTVLLSDISNSITEHLTVAGDSAEQLLGVGFTVPGPVTADGYVERCVNLKGWNDFYPAERLSEMLGGVNTKIINDANAAALGEVWKGSGKAYKDAFFITLGTGVGGAAICDGKILVGHHGLVAEIGHIQVREDEQDKCSCGGKGHLDQIASASGIVKEAKRALAAEDIHSALRSIPNFTSKDVFDCAHSGDEIAQKAVDTATKYLGKAIATACMLLDPEVIIIGGGVSAAGQYLVDKVDHYYREYETLSEHRAAILIAALGGDAGIYGAAKYLLDNL